jgi:endonuclease YncB( thermonuclease family)
MKNTLLYCYIIVYSIILISCNKNTKQDFISGKVVKIHDGDTYDLLLEDNTTIRVRMDGIDAPEKGMPFSKKAKQYLDELCQGQMIEIHNNELDQYGRTISFAYLEDGRELGREMLKAGYAWHYKKYNSNLELAALEDEAREAKRGLWRDKNPIAPWEVRKLRRQGISTKDKFHNSTDEEAK